MKRILAIAVCCAASVAGAADIHYRWKAQGGGFLDPVTQVPLDNEKVYLFDANVCSPNNLVENAKGGAPLVGQSYILAKVMTDGVIVAGDVFPYNVEAVGVVWNAYMATELERNGKRYVYVSPEVEVMGLDLGFTADIAFNNQAEYSGSVRDSESHVGPGWYEVGTAHAEICPGKGASGTEVSAADGDAAIGRVKVVTPDPAIVSDADYAKYFKLTVEPSTAGRYFVRAELDAEAIDLDKTVESFAARLADLAKKGGTTVTVEIECKPGLAYRVLSAIAVDGKYAEGETTPLATGTKTEVKVAVPEGDKAFFRIGVTPVGGK